MDYQALNKVTVKDTYPLPLIEECLDTLAGNQWFSKLEVNAAYWQIKHEDNKMTVFITKYGLFEFTRMGFGLCNAPAAFTRAINLVLNLGTSAETHLDNLRQVFKQIWQYGLKFKPRKCEFFWQKVPWSFHKFNWR